MNVDETVLAIIDLLQKKYKFLEDIHYLTKLQSQVIEKEEIGNLNKLVALKQEKIEQINDLDLKFEKYFLDLKNALNVENLEQVNESVRGSAELKRFVKNIIDIIKEISIIEKENSMKVKKLLNEIGGELKKMNNVNKINNAYSIGNAVAHSYYIDRKK
jgi:hypothetical protein